MNISIGIDPGIDTGGLSMIPENGEVKVIMTPRISVKGDIDLRAISSFFLDAADKIQEREAGRWRSRRGRPQHPQQLGRQQLHLWRETPGTERPIRYDGGDDGAIRISPGC